MRHVVTLRENQESVLEHLFSEIEETDKEHAKQNRVKMWHTENVHDHIVTWLS